MISLTGLLMSAYPDLQKKADSKLYNETGKHWHELTYDDWVPTSAWEMFMKEYSNASAAGERSLIVLGRKIYPAIKKDGGLPADMDTPLKAFMFEAGGFLTFHRGSGVKPRKIITKEEGHFVVDALSPGYSCKVIEGIYMGILEMFGVKGKVVQTQCVRRGDPTCVYDIRWPSL